MLIQDVIFGKKSAHTPLWMMRQAGRYLPEYLEVRKNFPDFMQFCYTPKAACEVTLQPITRFDFDAAIIFSDILVIPDALGQKVWFEPDHGPKLGGFDLSTLEKSKITSILKSLEPVYEAISLTKSRLSREKALFGFAGSPWTLACYMVEEGKSTDFSNIKRFSKTPEFSSLLKLLEDAVSAHLIAQIEAGADVVQLFDSWASLLDDESEMESFLLKPAQNIMKKVHEKYPKVPFVYYARGGSTLISRFSRLNERYEGPIVLGVHQNVDLNEVKHLPFPLQGNLCPEVLCNGGGALDSAVDEILEKMDGNPYIFNLGHGILKETPLLHVEQMIKRVRG